MHGDSVAVGSEIAQGGYSFVYSARDTLTGERFALKKVLCQSDEQVEMAKQEIQTHKALAHPHVMPLTDYAVLSLDASTFEYYLLFPFMEVRHVHAWSCSRSSDTLTLTLSMRCGCGSDETERDAARDDRHRSEVAPSSASHRLSSAGAHLCLSLMHVQSPHADTRVAGPRALCQDLPRSRRAAQQVAATRASRHQGRVLQMTLSRSL